MNQDELENLFDELEEELDQINEEYTTNPYTSTIHDPPAISIIETLRSAVSGDVQISSEKVVRDKVETVLKMAGKADEYDVGTIVSSIPVQEEG